MRRPELAALVLLAGCGTSHCPEPAAVVVHVQLADGTAIDDATIACTGPSGPVETVPLGGGDYACGEVAGGHDVSVAWRSSSWSRRFAIRRGSTECTTVVTAHAVVVLPPP
jgi:hypothetical protein